MVDWMMPIYKVIGAPFPKISLIVATLLGALLFGGWWWITGREYRELYQSGAKSEQAQKPPDGNAGTAPGAGQSGKSANSDKSSTAAKKTSPSAPTTDDEKRAIVMVLVQKFKDSHAGKLPTIAWVNEQLMEQGQTFLIPTPPPAQNKITCVNCTFEDNGVAIQNSNPDTNFDFSNTKFIGNQKAIVNTPPGQKKEDDKAKRPN
jgi:hypothetical protein